MLSFPFDIHNFNQQMNIEQGNMIRYKIIIYYNLDSKIECFCESEKDAKNLINLVEQSLLVTNCSLFDV